MTEPTVDQVRQTIADEWGSHLCYRDSFGTRSCSQDTQGTVGCRCADIARAIMSDYSLTTGLSGCLHPGNDPLSCQYEGGCQSEACDHYGKTEYRPRMTVLAHDPDVLYPNRNEGK